MIRPTRSPLFELAIDCFAILIGCVLAAMLCKLAVAAVDFAASFFGE